MQTICRGLLVAGSSTSCHRQLAFKFLATICARAISIQMLQSRARLMCELCAAWSTHSRSLHRGDVEFFRTLAVTPKRQLGRVTDSEIPERQLVVPPTTASYMNRIPGIWSILALLRTESHN